MLRKDVVLVMDGLARAAKELPPMPDAQEIRRIRERHAGNLTPITVCECGWSDLMHRMGCRHQKDFLDNTGHRCQWLFVANDGPLEGSNSRTLKHGVDFCFVGENDELQPESRDGD